MMGKIQLAVLIVFIVDVIALVGLGIGTNALAGVNTGGLAFTPTWHNDTSGAGGAIQPNVYVQLGTLPLTSSMRAAEYSTTLTFGIQVLSNGNCGNAGQPNYEAGGRGASWFSLSIGGAKFTALVNGQVQSGTYIPLSYNNTPGYTWSGSGNPSPGYFACILGSAPGAGNVQTTNFGTKLFISTVAIQGEIGAATLRIDYHASGPLCDGTPPLGTMTGLVCGEESTISSMVDYLQPQGGWTTDSYATIPILDGAASAQLVGAGPWFNGGTIQATVYTGYGGPAGYSVAIYNPSSKGGGLAPWQNNNQTVANNRQGGAVVSWSIPAGASTNCTINGCNQFQLILTSQALGQSISFPVDISPQYAASTPGISYTDASGLIYPSQGDTITLTFTSSGQNASKPGTFLIHVFYLLASQSVQSTHPCDATFVTACGGTFLNATTTGGNNFQATYTFAVSPPLNSVGIGIQAQALTSNQQSSSIAYYTVALQPANCQQGTVCNPSTFNANIWHTWGPVLLFLAIVLLTVFLILFVRIPIPAIVGVVAGEILVLALLYSTIAAQFVPGGAFG